MFVADFIGSPPMNFIRVRQRACERGARTLSVNGVDVGVPAIREDAEPHELALGVRPEHIRFDDARSCAAQSTRREYLGTTQIVAVETRGTIIKARAAGEPCLSRSASRSGLAFDARKLSLSSTRRRAGRSAPRSMTEAVYG